MTALGLLRSERTKFRTLRATVRLLAGALLVAGTYGFLFGTAAARDYKAASAAAKAAFDPAGAAFRAMLLAGVLVSAVGVLAVTAEYATGTIRAGVTAVPRRAFLVAAKAAVVALVLLPAGPLLALTSFVASQTALAARGVPSLALGDPGVAGAVAGSALFAALLGLYGVALGFLLRRSAGAICLATFLLLLPGMAALLPPGAARWVVTWWPSAAGAQVFAVHPGAGALGPLAGTGVLAATVLALLLAAVAVFRRRDA
ncbi:hypothetical protein GCM10009530_68010 [Microbispora corallina]|uniref:ABC transporter permease n=1 Tax=Microbispora corallina TaxID=83302 RepID=A0ABQ4G9S4_9ACTN|nr:hypothetical protein [Microbispora corallina]GIH43802.1 hypothetical protein Mco01_68020 [Microbispora corallina]